MSDFPELQHALVDAARHRYGRAPRAWRVMRPVAVAAVCAAATVAVITVAGTPADDRQVNPPAARPELTPVERDFEVFRRPKTAADELPDLKAVMKRWTPREDRDTINPRIGRKVVDDGHWQVFLNAARKSGAPAVCATVFYDGKLQQWAGCSLKYPRAEIGPKTPLGNGWVVADYSFPPSTTDPGAYMIIVADGVDELTYTYADGSTQVLPVKDNIVFVSPIDRWPTRLSWVDDVKPQSQTVLPAKDYNFYIHVRPGFGE
jgi:hypothetical protein